MSNNHNWKKMYFQLNKSATRMGIARKPLKACTTDLHRHLRNCPINRSLFLLIISISNRNLHSENKWYHFPRNGQVAQGKSKETLGSNFSRHLKFKPAGHLEKCPGSPPGGKKGYSRSKIPPAKTAHTTHQPNRNSMLPHFDTRNMVWKWR